MKSICTILILLQIGYSVCAQNKKAIKDTTIVIDSVAVLPQVIQQVLLTRKPTLKKGWLCYSIQGCYLYNNQFFLPFGKKSKIAKSINDGCQNNFVSLKGKLCAASGCIGGIGNGDCKGMINSNEAEILNISFLTKAIN